MKKILVLYYSQTGQLESILKSVFSLAECGKEAAIDYIKLKPETEYPYPWKGEFFDSFPESVLGITCNMEEPNIDLSNQYDLIILGYQPWYLSPSIPFWSFLSSNFAHSYLKGKNVVTVIGARNMWIGSQNIVKSKLREIGANLSGNIVLQDKADNLISAFTIVQWLIHGRKKVKILPEAGISQIDISNASIFGDIIIDSLKNNEINTLQKELIRAGAVKIKYHILKIELTARRIFVKFANLIHRKEKKSQEQRRFFLQVFKWYLIFVLFIVSPFVSLLFMITRIILYPVTNKKINYFCQVK